MQESDEETRKIRAEGLNRYEDINEILHYQGLLLVSEIILTELISKHHNDPLTDHFGINKIKELISWK